MRHTLGAGSTACHSLYLVVAENLARLAAIIINNLGSAITIASDALLKVLGI